MNVGKKEGSEIIQLFGRGVRLKGFRFKLKRTSALDPLDLQGEDVPRRTLTTSSYWRRSISSAFVATT